MAYEKGFYRKQGIDLMVLRGGPEFPPTEPLARNKIFPGIFPGILGGF